MECTTCCCCFDLKGGAIATGVALLVIHTLLFISEIATTCALYAPGNMLSYHVDFSNITNGDMQIIRSNYDVYYYDPTTWALLGVSIAIFFINVPFNVLLVWGAVKDVQCLVIGWLVYHAISCVCMLAASIPLILLGVFSGEHGIPGLVIFGIVLCLLTVPFWYWFAMVFRYFKKLSMHTLSISNSHQLVEDAS